jgi:cephalosporin hydroxylase
MMEPAALAYLKWFHETNIWKHMFYRGVRTLKLPSDMWNYQEILFERDIHWVIETGTRHGGSALYFADLLRNAGRDGRVITIDYQPALDPRVLSDDRIDFMTGDSAAPEVVAEALAKLPGDRKNLFLILDSDHSEAHVRRELDAWVPRLQPGDYLLVEDTIVNGNPVRPTHGPGPLEAIRAFIAANPGMLIPDQAREAKFGATCALEGYYVKA